jgi:hypothetical protein
MDQGAIGLAQGPQKFNDGSRKTNYPGMIDRGFPVFSILFIKNIFMQGRHFGDPD